MSIEKQKIIFDFVAKILFVFTIIFLVIFPYMRIKIAGAPIYFYTISTLTLLLYAFFKTNFQHYLNHNIIKYLKLFFIVSSIVFVVNVAIFQYGILFRLFVVVQKYTAIILIFVIPIFFIGSGNCEKDMNFVKRILIITGTLVSIWGIFQILNISIVNELTEYYYFDLSKVNADFIQGQGFGVRRSMAGMWNSNVYGPALALMFPILIYYPKFKFKKLIILIWLAGMVSSGSRQVFILIVIYGLIYSLKEFKLKFIQILFSITILLFIILFSPITNFIGKDTLLRGLGQNNNESTILSGVSERSSGYENIKNRFLDNPFRFAIGDGIGNKEAQYRSGLADYTFVSNSFLLVFIDNGVLGLALYLMILFSIFKLSYTYKIDWGIYFIIGLIWFHMTDNAMYASPISFTLSSLLISVILIDYLNKFYGSLD